MSTADYSLNDRLVYTDVTEAWFGGHLDPDAGLTGTRGEGFAFT
jgi:hypothetical protein